MCHAYLAPQADRRGRAGVTNLSLHPSITSIQDQKRGAFPTCSQSEKGAVANYCRRGKDWQRR
jgi:hypothetical protein